MGAITLRELSGRLQYKNGPGAYVPFNRMVSVTDFGATGDGITDDAPAIQAAIDFAKNQIGFNAVVWFPDGKYKINTPLNCTAAPGLSLRSYGGRWNNAIILGNTGGLMIDFTASGKSSLEGLHLWSPNLPAATGYNPSTIGVLCALGMRYNATSGIWEQYGGLDCSITNCYIELGSFPGVNGGLGSIPLLNIRSEQFVAPGNTFQGDSPVILSNTESLLATTGFNFVASSPFTTIATTANLPNGSMGVVQMEGTTLYSYYRLTPALLLNGTNNVHFKGYMGRLIPLAQSQGSYESAIRVCQYSMNIHIKGTIESFSTVLELQNDWIGGTINVCAANQLAPNRPLILRKAGSSVQDDARINISLPNVPERSGRYFMYETPPVDGNGLTLPSTCITLNSSFTCKDITDNALFISAHLLKQADNCRFNSAKPFRKEAGYVYRTTSSNQLLGTAVNGGGTIDLVLNHFNYADRTLADLTTLSTVFNGGYYHIKVDGALQGGNYGTNNGAVLVSLRGDLILQQTPSGVKLAPESNLEILNQSTTNSAYLDFSDLSLVLDTTGTKGVLSLRLAYVYTGANPGEGFNWKGRLGINSEFFVNNAVFLD